MKWMTLLVILRRAYKVFRIILFYSFVFALLATNLGAYEPEGFNGKLYAAEVAAGGAMTIAPLLFGITAYSSANY